MIIDGKKLACEPCIKGHRATHCKHVNRTLIEIKPKGRPSTQCKRCRDLRVIRQLHVKCECDKPKPIPRKRTDTIVVTADIKSAEARTTIENTLKQLRVIAPRPDIPHPMTPYDTVASPIADRGLGGSCCSPSFSEELPGQQTCSPLPHHTSVSSPIPATSTLYDPPQSSIPDSQPARTDPQPDRPPESLSDADLPELQPLKDSVVTTGSCCDRPSSGTSSCCSTEKKDKNGDRIRVVTCRCGDSCACIGCDAHPSRVMRGQVDPYAGYSPRRRLSIAAICSTPETEPPKSTLEHPSSVLGKDGTILCGCGCSQPFASCSGCFRELCDGKFSCPHVQYLTQLRLDYYTSPH